MFFIYLVYICILFLHTFQDIQFSISKLFRSTIYVTFEWKKCKDIPREKTVSSQPVALNESGKLYWVPDPLTVLEYTPSQDQWAGLPPLPVRDFTIATLDSQLLVVGGREKSTFKTTNKILLLNKQEWIEPYLPMPTAVVSPAVTSSQCHLIVAGGSGSLGYTPDVNILNTASNQWITAQPLPRTDYYNAVQIENAICLVAKYSQTVLRAHVPTLISGAKSGVWETLPNTPYYRSSPVTIDNTLLTVGGSDKSQGGNPTTSIQMYEATTKKWTKVSDLPEPNNDPCCTVCLLDRSSKLFVLGKCVYVATVTVNY